MKPGDHPEFFRLPPPPGASRESTIRLDAQGRFWHDGGLVENEALTRALHSWISKHPDNGRTILTNGYDWTYFTVDDAPYFVTAIRVEAEAVFMRLTDGSEEKLTAQGLRVGKDGAVYVSVKDGAFEAKFTRHAQNSLEPVMVEGEGGEVLLRLGGKLVALPVD